MLKTIKTTVFLTLISLLVACGNKPLSSSEQTALSANINQVMDNWHLAAAAANGKDYFSAMDTGSIFIGTDASENWRKSEFEECIKEYFANGKAWSFTALQRNVYWSDDGKVAWFDELLNTTNLGICRGSGVLTMTSEGWKIKHYVLSVTVPNETVDKVTQLNKQHERQIKAKYDK